MTLNESDLAPVYQLFQRHTPELGALLNNPLLHKDIWYTIDDLGLKVNEHQKVLTLNFSKISPDWLKLLVKLYILVRSKQKLSVNYLSTDMVYLKKFSRFINQQSVYYPFQIDNQVFEEFDYYLKSSGVSSRSVALNYIALKNFFDLCRYEGWLEVDTYWFQGKHKRISYPKNDKIDYIPELVWNQLDEHLHHLPEPIQRMVLIIRILGLRIGELLNLPLDCLRKRSEQWRIRLLTEKYKTEDELPIPVELVVVIKEQQAYIRKYFGNSYDKLFGSNDGGNTGEYKPAPRVMKNDRLNFWLNKLAKSHNICDKEGNIWKFSSHQFRKTIATVMTNAGIRDLIVQKYLRHRSPDMQNFYKHLLQQVLEDEYEELIKDKKYVDNTGAFVAAHKPTNPVTELLRRKLYQITTQYGECHRPTLKDPCPTVNACWRCKDWRTSTEDLPYLKEDLERIESELEIAERLGMVRQQQGLEDDRNSLTFRIKGLERNDD